MFFIPLRGNAVFDNLGLAFASIVDGYLEIAQWKRVTRQTHYCI